MKVKGVITTFYNLVYGDELTITFQELFWKKF